MSFRRRTASPYSFSCPQGTDTFTKDLTRARFIEALSVHIHDDNAGPILVNCYIERDGVKYPLGEPTGIFDGAGPNAKRFEWVGSLPLDWAMPNNIIVEWSNYSGSDIDKVIVGVITS